MREYAHPESLISTEWVAAHAADPNVRVVEVDVDTTDYGEGHVPAAICWAWNTQLCDTVRRDILSRQAFERLMKNPASATIRRSFSTATTTTGLPHGRSGK